MNKHRAILIITLLIVPGCIQQGQKTLIKQISVSCKHHHQLKTSIDLCEQSHPPVITIWIHGTRLLPKSLFKTFFYSKPGLHHYSEIDSIYYQHKIAQMIIDSNPEQFPAATFYLFGWSGALSFEERECAARKLYEDLKVICFTYRQTYGVAPVIRIISHSHGGNIALLLEKVKDSDDSQLFIDQLLLLACPVQIQTMKYVQSNIFGKVYSLYSLLDILQLADPQGLQNKDKKEDIPLFSKRFFTPHEKIEQVAIKMDDRSLMHIEFIKPKFLAQLSKIVNTIDQWHQSSSLSSAQWTSREKCLCISTRAPQTRS